MRTEAQENRINQYGAEPCSFVYVGETLIYNYILRHLLHVQEYRGHCLAKPHSNHPTSLIEQRPKMQALSYNMHLGWRF